ncbi:MAG: Electron transport complex subunit RsxB [Deltaproteobacteria bacterium ADurb.Bin510]|nr:MAG: Electron transport complex subunit RsxB [Deltaproteobacteria bacterium ADurb.Bin510]
MRRKIIEIDEELCNGCGQCVRACAEGALKLIDGKARLVSEVYCDGLGACIGECPAGALKIVEREAGALNEQALKAHVQACPGSASVSLAGAGSSLEHFPVKLQLINPGAPFLKGAELLLLADCCGVCYPALHRDLLKGRAVAIGCPKLDVLEKHVERLSAIIGAAGLKKIIVVHMEVPCCSGLVRAALAAARRSGVTVPIEHITISRQGEVLESGPVSLSG